MADHDLVLTTDAPLALALNRRAVEPRLGAFAATPRSFASQGLEVADRRDLFHEIVRETDLSFKQAATMLDLALRSWEDTGRAEAILEHARYDRPGMRELIEVIQAVESTYTLREDVQVPASLDVAVIDPASFSALDRRVLLAELDANGSGQAGRGCPGAGQAGQMGDGMQASWTDGLSNVEAVSPFEPTGSFELGEIGLMASTVAMAQAVEAHITPANADDIGIVLDPAGSIRPLLEASLDAQGIAYHTEEPLAEHPGLRSFLRALRMGMARDRLRGRDVRGLLVDLGMHASPRDDEALVRHLDHASLTELANFWEELEELRVGEALDAFQAIAPGAPRELGELIEELELGQEPVTRELVNALAFYLDTYPVEREHRREGVLLASGRDNAYVDRPLVFHLGLGTGWAQSVPEDPWLGPNQRARREAQDLARFERLLQSGRQAIYLAQDTRQGKPVTPCLHLHELIEAPFERFAQLPHRRLRPSTTPPASTPGEHVGFAREETLFIQDAEASPEAQLEAHIDTDVDASPVRTLASGDLNQLTYCPRDWFVDQLVAEPENIWLRRGQLFHAFAELACSHPDLVDPSQRASFEDTLESLVEVALGELEALMDPDDRPAMASELRIGFTNIARWIHDQPPEGEAPTAFTDPPPERQNRANPFAEHLEVEVDRERTERWFQTDELGVHGKVDLVHGPHRLVDWKSTRNPDSLAATVKAARVQQADEDPPSLQPSVYLLQLRALQAQAPLEFVFVDLLANRKQAVRGEEEMDAITRQLDYYPGSLASYIATEQAYEQAVLSSNERKDVFAAVGYEAYRAYVEDHEVPPLEDKQEAKHSAFADGLVDLAQRKRGAPATSEKAARSAVGKLVKLQDQMLFAEDLDALQEHIDSLLADLHAWRKSCFPVGENVDLDETAHPDCILEDLSRHRAAGLGEAADE